MERIDASALSAAESLNLLVRKKVRAVIVGGIQERYQAMLLNHQIKVFWGVIGDIDDVLAAYMKGALYPGIGAIAHSLSPKNPR